VAQYQVELRFAGYARECVRGLIFAASRRFGLRGVNRNNAVPRLTVFGPFTAFDDQKVMESVVEAASRFKLVTYNVRGFDHYSGGRSWLLFNQHMNVIYLDVQPSQELLDLRRCLADMLGQAPNDAESGELYKFHAAVPFRNLGGKFDRVWSYLKENEEPNLLQRLVRVNVLKNGRLMCEYDFVNKKLTVMEKSVNSRLMVRFASAFERRKKEIRLFIMPGRRRRLKQTKLVEPETYPWASSIVLPVMSQLKRDRSQWIPKIISPAMAKEKPKTFQTTFEGEGEEILPIEMPPLLQSKSKKRLYQTTLVERAAAEWIPGIVMPILTRRKVDAS